MMNSTKVPFLSVIIPVFNEERRIRNLKKIIAYLKEQKYSWELIVVDDGSKDRTKKLLNSIKGKLKFNLISYSENMGKGFAIKTGMLKAKGKYRLFLDIDLSTPISEINRFLPYLKKYDIVIGSRKLKTSNLIERQPFIREYLGKMFTVLSQIILQLKISDFTCGFKCFSQKAVEQIFSRQTINRWGFDSEILCIGKSKKIAIKEVSVTWRNDPSTKVKLPQDIISSLTELIKIRLNFARGLYE